MALEKLRDPKTGRFIAGPNSIQNILPAIADDFRQISVSILKLTKLDDDEKKQRKLDDTKQRKDQYAEKYKKVKTSPTKVKKIDKQRSIIDMLKDLFGGIFKFLIISIGVIGLAKLLASRDIVGGLVSFIKNVLLAAVDVFSKVLSTIGSLLSDKDIQKSFIDLMKNAFKFVGELLSKGFDLLVGLVKDKDVQGSFVEALIATFQAAYEVIKAGFNILWSSLNENFTSVVQAIVGSIQVIATAIAEGVKFVAEIMSDQRILNSIRDVAVAVFGFITAAFKEDYLLEGGKVKSGAQMFGEWVGEAIALTALLLYWKAKFFKMGLGNFGGGGVDIPDIDRKKGPKPKPKPQSKPGFLERSGKYISEKAAQLRDKFTKGFESAKNSIKKYAEKAARYVKVMATNSKVQAKVLAAFSKRFGAAAAARISGFLAAQAAALAAAPFTAGASLLLNILMAGLAAYDIYCLYDLLFVSSDGENEDGGIAASIQSDVDKAEQAEKENVKPTPVAVPIANPAATPTANRSATSSTPAMPESIRNAPVPAASVAPSPATDYPANWTASAMAVPAGVALEKRQVGGLGYGGKRKDTKGVIVHHTGGRGLDVAIRTLQNRKLSYHYLVDRDGKVVQILPDDLMAWHAGKTNKKPDFNNSNTISISMVAADDTDVTAEQIASATGLEEILAKKYGFTKSNAYGHGEVSSAKHPKEGMTIASAIRSGRTDQAIQNVTEKSLGEIKQNVPPSIANQIKQPGKAIETVSGEVSASLRMLEDMFLAGRPSFTDMSTTINQNNTYSRPGGNIHNREQEAIQFLIQRQTS